MRLHLTLMPLIVSVAACSPLVSYTPTRADASRPPRPPSDVELYSISVPACPYEEIGIIEGHQRLAPEGRTLEAMRREAARRGADALLLLGSGHGGGVHARGSHDYAAVAIAYSEPMCTTETTSGGR